MRKQLAAALVAIPALSFIPGQTVFAEDDGNWTYDIKSGPDDAAGRVARFCCRDTIAVNRSADENITIETCGWFSRNMAATDC